MPLHPLSDLAVSTSSNIKAILGPTNTGKTYQALKEMTAHNSGVIGFPLRLLARENYDRLVKEKGRSHVALVTGEEKIIPPRARYYVCTVESMPIEQKFDFLAIDEIQLCADPERGHVFTDRLLRARGLKTTMFLGAETIRQVIASLVPNVEFETRPRLSELTYRGFKKLTRLPKRSAIVAFSIDDIYQIAELVRRQRGGSALVLGALSPRARNAQVAMYQAGEVDYLIATDAIGMGLNMDINHVALAGTRKYDGQKVRSLGAAELAQIAGRAGRYLRDGTFGTTAHLKGLSPEMVEAIQTHQFETIRFIFWRNAHLDFASLKSLLSSLNRNSDNSMLQKGRPGDDLTSLTALSKKEDVLARATSKARIRLLWDVCQIPDFRKTLNETHEDLLCDIFIRLCEGYLPKPWVESHLERLDNTEGDVDALMTRISHVRTWTYISHRSDWLEDTDHWRARTREIEDKLSDALHLSLTHRFVDKRSAMLSRSLEDEKGDILAGIRQNGEVIVEGHLIGHIEGFRFIPDTGIQQDGKALLQTTARRVLKPEIKKRRDRLMSQKGRFSLNEDGKVFWQKDETNPTPGAEIASVKKGEGLYSPSVSFVQSDLVEQKDKSDIEKTVQEWLTAHIRETLFPMMDYDESDTFKGAAAGIGFQLKENMGIVPRQQVKDLIDSLDSDGRTQLRHQKVRLGPETVFVRTLLKPAAIRLKAMLWNLYHDKDLPAVVPHDGAVSVPSEPYKDVPDYAMALGYPVCGPRAVRVDMLDRLISAVYDNSKDGKFQAKHDMAEWLGSSIDDLYSVLEALGHKKINDPEGESENGAVSKSEAVDQETKTDEQPRGKDTASDEAEPENAIKQAKDKEEPEEKPELAIFALKQFVSDKKGGKHKGKKGKPHKHVTKSGKSDPKKSGKKGGQKPGKKDNHPSEQPLAHSPFSVLQDLKKQGTDNE